MKLYPNKMKSYLLLVFGCLLFAEQITELTADNSSVVVSVTNATADETSVTLTTTNTTNAPPSITTTTTTVATPSTTIITTSTTTEEETTKASTVSTTNPPTTTVLPPSVSDPSTGSWTVYGENDTRCIKLEAAIQFRITYQQKNENNVTAKLNIPKNATVENNTCDAGTIRLRFDDNMFEITFKNNSNEIAATNFILQYFMDSYDFPDGKDTGKTMMASATNLTEFKVSPDKSYLCKVETKIDMENVVLSMQDLQVEAFRHSKDDKFSEATECSGDGKINDIVPIAVGCALAVLVVIVLIAYLVGRQRSRQQGYQSV